MNRALLALTGSVVALIIALQFDGWSPTVWNGLCTTLTLCSIAVIALVILGESE